MSTEHMPSLLLQTQASLMQPCSVLRSCHLDVLLPGGCLFYFQIHHWLTVLDNISAVLCHMFVAHWYVCKTRTFVRTYHISLETVYPSPCTCVCMHSTTPLQNPINTVITVHLEQLHTNSLPSVISCWLSTAACLSVLDYWLGWGVA